MGMTGGGDGTGLQSEINVTPMVDIMLVLLIIFMVVTPLLQKGVTVVLPQGDNPLEDAGVNKDSAIVVAVPAAGQYYVGRDLMPSKERLIELIKRRMDALKPNDARIVYIKGGVNVPYGDVVSVIDSIREAGFDQIGLVADKKKETK